MKNSSTKACKIRDEGDFMELDVIVEKHKKIKTNVMGLDGKPVLDEGKPLKEYTQVYTGFFTAPTSFAKDGITLYGAVYDERNRILKTRCSIYDKHTGKFYVVNHSRDDVKKSLGKRTHVGFSIGQK